MADIINLHRGFVRPLPLEVLELGEPERLQIEDDPQVLSLTAALSIAFLLGMVIGWGALMIAAWFVGALS